MGTRCIAGCMTGTSLDAIDAALVEVHGHGLDLRASVRDVVSAPLAHLADPLRRIAHGACVSAQELAEVAHEFALAIADLVARLNAESLDLCAIHGQTVHHAPPYSWQLLNPWPIAHRLRCDVVYDLRGADLAAGGQGAPITPLADAMLFGSDAEERVIINLGGFCNATVLPSGAPTKAFGRDVCACNQVLDAVARRELGCAYDKNGERALRGQVNPQALAALKNLLSEQRSAGRSLGTGDEAVGWVDACADTLDADDLAATASEGVGGVIREWIDACAPNARVFLAGGGVHNHALIAAIGVSETTQALGVPPAAREAAAMSVLGALAQDRTPITLPSATGRPQTPLVDGAWVFAREDL